MKYEGVKTFCENNFKGRETFSCGGDAIQNKTHSCWY
jgi:hypothetical protein